MNIKVQCNAWMNIKVQCNKVNGSREKNVKPKIIPDGLSKGKIEELGCKNLFAALQVGNDPLGTSK